VADSADKSESVFRNRFGTCSINSQPLAATHLREAAEGIEAAPGTSECHGGRCVQIGGCHQALLFRIGHHYRPGTAALRVAPLEDREAPAGGLGVRGARRLGVIAKIIRVVWGNKLEEIRGRF